MNSSSGPQEGTQEPVGHSGSSAAPHQAAPQAAHQAVLSATALHGQEHAVTPSTVHMGSWEGKGHALLRPILVGRKCLSWIWGHGTRPGEKP